MSILIKGNVYKAVNDVMYLEIKPGGDVYDENIDKHNPIGCAIELDDDDVAALEERWARGE